MVNRYFSYVAITKHQEAAIFSDEDTWMIFDILRKAGAKGLTAHEIHMRLEKEKRVGISRSKIYALLKRLYKEDWIHRYWDKDAGPQREGAQRNVIAFDWGDVPDSTRRFFYEEFYKIIIEKEKDFMEKKVYPIFFTYFTKVMNDLKDDPKTEKWLPQKGQESICKFCHDSHEGIEFFSCLLDIATNEFLSVKSEQFNEFLKKNEMYEDIEESPTE